jgi:hypothetical protein
MRLWGIALLASCRSARQPQAQRCRGVRVRATVNAAGNHATGAQRPVRVESGEGTRRPTETRKTRGTGDDQPRTARIRREGQDGGGSGTCVCVSSRFAESR